MSEVAAADTTFDKIIPDKIWIGVTNMKSDGKLHVIAEINGIEKQIWSMKPSYAEPEEGMINDYTQLTWVIQKALLAKDQTIAELHQECNLHVGEIQLQKEQIAELKAAKNDVEKVAFTWQNLSIELDGKLAESQQRLLEAMGQLKSAKETIEICKHEIENIRPLSFNVLQSWEMCREFLASLEGVKK